MPVTKQALKKLRHDRRRAVQTAKVRKEIRTAIKKFRKTPSNKELSHVFSVLDKAGKLHVLHPNKADRLKSRLSKNLSHTAR